MILSDWEIRKLCQDYKMIEPFEDKQIRHLQGRPCVSFGESSFGYDLRLSEKPMKLFRFSEERFDARRDVPVIDLKEGNFLESRNVVELKCRNESFGNFFEVPPLSYVLGTFVERFNMPSNVCGLPFGKSTYGRSGLMANFTPFEPGWKGFPTASFFNATPYKMRLYANEGIAQIVFFRGKDPQVSYGDREGKYQNQDQRPTFSKI